MILRSTKNRCDLPLRAASREDNIKNIISFYHRTCETGNDVKFRDQQPEGFNNPFSVEPTLVLTSKLDGMLLGKSTANLCVSIPNLPLIYPSHDLP
jgi:hypothetical protein